MKSDKYKSKEKEIIAYVRELDQLAKISRDAPIVPIAKPYQNGWIKYFVLRDDYTRRDDAQVFHTILKTIGTEIFSRKADFLDRKGNERHPGLRIIGKREWEVLNWPAQYKKYFRYGVWNERNIWGHNTKGIEGWKMERPFFFIEAVRPHFITHTRVIYPEIESRKRYIQNKFEREQLWYKFHKIKGHGRWSRDWVMAKARFLEALSTKEIEDYDKS